MVTLTRLNGSSVVVNAELIEWIEQHPDTTISLATGSKIVVKESADAVVQKVLEYRRKLIGEGHQPAETLLKNYRRDIK